MSTALEQAKEHDFQTVEELYNYIIDSIVNGQRQQAIQLYQDLEVDDKVACRTYIKDAYEEPQYYEFVELIIQ